MDSKPKMLDLFCGAGGCTKGYQRAGFWVRGVDINPQPRYCGEEFIQADALEYLARLIESGEVDEFSAVHASPPCQQYSRLRSITKRKYADLVEPTRALLIAAGKPFVIENVPGAPLGLSIILCGLSFGLRVYRHRVFESSLLLLAPTHERHRERVLNGSYSRDWTGFVSVTGGHNTPVAHSALAMGIDWMSKAELSQAIPPAYTEFIGNQLMEVLCWKF